MSQNLFKWKHIGSERILLCVRWYLKYPLSYRMYVEMMIRKRFNNNPYNSYVKLKRINSSFPYFMRLWLGGRFRPPKATPFLNQNNFAYFYHFTTSTHVEAIILMTRCGSEDKK